MMYDANAQGMTNPAGAGISGLHVRRCSMSRRLIPLVLALLGLIVAAGPAAADRLTGSAHGGKPFATELLGANEIPGPGDPDGEGSARLTLNLGQSEICFELSVTGISPVTAAHIHVGPVGVAGPVVVPLTPPTSGFSAGCATVDRELIEAIMENSVNYYVNVHNADFPAGALRGQLG
jgi:hypothetical protein